MMTGTAEPMEILDACEDSGSETKVPSEVLQVWKHMQPLKENGIRVKATCNHCKKTFPAKVATGISHLRTHLKSCLAKKSVDQNRVSLKAEENSDEPISGEAQKFDLKRMQVLVPQFIVSWRVPFSTAENSAFIDMMRLACPEYPASITAHTCEREALKLYKKEKAKIKQEIVETPGCLSLAIDNWHNELTNEKSICITVHWIDTYWKMQKRIIAFRDLMSPFDGLSVANEIALILDCWNIEKKILSISLDAGSYNDQMIDELKERQRRNGSLICNGLFYQVRCCCDILNSIVRTTLDFVDGVVSKIRSAFHHLNWSSSKKLLFFEIATKIYCLGSQKRLRDDVPVKWDSTYVMLEQALYFKDVLIHWGKRNHDFMPLILSSDEWERIAYIHEFLKVFYDVALTISASKYPTSNVYLGGVWKIKKHLLECAKNSPDYMVPMIKDMQVKIEKYWSDYSLLLSCCAVMDPCCKMSFIEWCYSEEYGDNSVYHVEKVFTTLKTLFAEYKGKSSGVVVMKANFEDQGSNSGSKSTIGVGEQTFKQYLKQKGRLADKKSELELYLDEPELDPESEIDIMDYWQNTAHRFPTLALVARDLLAIPVSTVIPKSTFNLDKKVIYPCLSELASKRIEALICYEDWLRVQGMANGVNGQFECDFDESDEDEDCFQD